MEHTFFRTVLMASLCLASMNAMATYKVIYFNNSTGSDVTVNIYFKNGSSDTYIAKANTTYNTGDNYYAWDDVSPISSIDWANNCTLNNGLTKDQVLAGYSAGSPTLPKYVHIRFDGTNYACNLENT